MKVIHLMGRRHIVCPTPAITPTTSVSLANVTCSRCLSALARIAEVEGGAADDRRRWAKYAADCEAVGMGAAWELVSTEGDSAAIRMAAEMLGSVARFLVETRDRRERAA